MICPNCKVRHDDGDTVRRVNGGFLTTDQLSAVAMQTHGDPDDLCVNCFVQAMAEYV